jgi:Flp pilus assembly protein TadG
VTCDPLPATGLGANIGPLLVVAIVCLIAGTTLVLLARRTRGGPAVLAVLLLLGTVTTLTTLGIQTPAQAATPGCSSSPSSSGSSSSSVGRLIITQTSTMVGLAPGVAPAPITGSVENDSAESTHITAVEVEINSVTPGPGSAAGSCGPSDYHLIAARMRVERTLEPGASTPFAGASIGFSNKTTNQDACKGAAIQLLYTANPD